MIDDETYADDDFRFHTTNDKQFDFQYGEDRMPTIESAVFQALGAASMAWEQAPAGVFDDTRARQIGKRLLQEIRKLTASQDYEVKNEGAVEAAVDLNPQWLREHAMDFAIATRNPLGETSEALVNRAGKILAWLSGDTPEAAAKRVVADIQTQLASGVLSIEQLNEWLEGLGGVALHKMTDALNSTAATQQGILMNADNTASSETERDDLKNKYHASGYRAGWNDALYAADIRLTKNSLPNAAIIVESLKKD